MNEDVLPIKNEEILQCYVREKNKTPGDSISWPFYPWWLEVIQSLKRSLTVTIPKSTDHNPQEGQQQNCQANLFSSDEKTPMPWALLSPNAHDPFDPNLEAEEPSSRDRGPINLGSQGSYISLENKKMTKRSLNSHSNNGIKRYLKHITCIYICELKFQEVRWYIYIYSILHIHNIHINPRRGDVTISQLGPFIMAPVVKGSVAN